MSGLNERRFWNATFAHPDPWNYASEYEQTKFRHTLDLLPDAPVGSAIELGCSEGIFTAMLAPRVKQLLAIDISDRALARAEARCADVRNVGFARHDISQGIPDG